MSMIVNIGSDESDSASEGCYRPCRNYSEECGSAGMGKSRGYLHSILRRGRSVSWVLPEDELWLMKEELDIELASIEAARWAFLEGYSSTFWNEIIMEGMERLKSRLQHQWRRAVERAALERLDQYGNYIQPVLDPEERMRQEFEAEVDRLARERVKQREDRELSEFRASCQARERKYGKYGEKKRRRKCKSKSKRYR
ncbi:hypothetical protein BJ508DRAFT_336971 [Ascobolus immersus RN42]|uniref:Uncharacterized protein n=1 Tax=Ascobolus immersus RN42 TaxID=1160509 RepID=A0A3N4H6U1_ASCIM|nr:hypothetical protein BJ508DRAFT_336971 [Ascobolus immersus RN42]